MDGKVYDVLTFVVRDNVLSYGNSFITISNITKVSVDTPRRSKTLLKWSISLLSIGLFILITSKSIFSDNIKAFGTTILILGVVLLLAWLYNAPSPCLMISLSSGEYVGFSSSNLAFLRQTVIQLKECINNNKNMTVDLSSSNIISGDVNIENKNIGTGNSIIVPTMTTAKKGSNIIIGDNNYANSTYISDVEWGILKDELLSMKGNLSINSAERRLVDDSLSFINRNDKNGFLNYFKEHKNEFYSDVFSSMASTALMGVLTQIGKLLL